MFGPVRGVGEGLVASLVLAHVRLLPGVRAQVGLQVLQTGVGLGTAFKLYREKNHNVLFLVFNTGVGNFSDTFSDWCSLD